MGRKGIRIVIAAGGTGGHVFPGLALAEALRRHSPGSEIVFVGAFDRMEARLVPAAGWPFVGIRARGLVGMGSLRRVANAAALAVGLLQALWRVGRLRPSLVVGMGGYVSAPVLLAARLLGRKTAIHESNMSPGKANLVLGRRADLVMVAWDTLAGAFPGRRVEVTGTPVRREARAGERPPAEPGAFRLLVLGGSQGARSLNRMVLAAMEHLDRQGLRVVHQAGDAHLDEVREGYRKIGFEAEVVAFITEMGSRYAWADVVICRAGAATLAELALNGCAAILVPLAAAGGHQGANATVPESRGAALMVADEGAAGGARLAAAVRLLRDDPARRERLSRAMGHMGRPDAAEVMARACLELAGAA